MSLPPLHSHPVPRRCHDRTIVVQLAPDRITVRYRLEVDEFTVVFDDLPALGDQVDLTKFRKPQEFYETFTRCYAPILAGNLLAKLDGQSLEFRCVKHAFTLQDEHGVPLDHLRCDYVFQATLPESNAAASHRLIFKEANYELEEGQIRLSLGNSPTTKLLSKTEPDPQIQARSPAELEPGDDARLRKLEATFTLAPSQDAAAAPTPLLDVESPREQPRFPGLHELFRETRYGFWALLGLAAAFGAVHALTPGHGKTLVAAYLVGERGTIGHAFLLGMVTTLTHTGVVLAIAVALRIYFPSGGLSEAARQDLQMALGLGGGLLVAGLGAWLLLCRLSGQADHVHLPGQGHHHHHGHAPHHHHPLPSQPINRWGLVLLGISGGLVPCWDAILMLLVAVSTNQLALALPLLLAFSAGLAGVLVAIGIVVVRVKGFAGSRWGESRLLRLLPVLSALVVTGLGLWLCYESVHAGETPSARQHARP